MNSLSNIRKRYLPSLLDGDRAKCRNLLRQARADGASAEDILLDVIWPTMGEIDESFDGDRINFVAEHMAVRINRTLADQLQLELPVCEPNGRSAVVCCSQIEAHELGAQIISDLFEAKGWDVRFVGSGVPMDELVQLIGQLRPDLLICYGTEPSGIPELRRILTMLHQIGSSPKTAVLTAGGIFKRAKGLWIEVGADDFAPDARTALAKAESGIEIRNHFVPTEGQPKRRRRRKKLVAQNA